MKLDILVPISVVIGIVYAIRVLVDARWRRYVVDSAASAAVIESLLRHEDQRRRQSVLRWGIVLTALALGFALVQWMGWTEITPGLIAVLAGATGLGNLAFFALSRRNAVAVGTHSP